MKILQSIVVFLVVLHHVRARAAIPPSVGRAETAYDEYSSYMEADIVADAGYQPLYERVLNTETHCTSGTCTNKKSSSQPTLEIPQMSITQNTKLWNGGRVPYIIDFETSQYVYVHDNIKAAISTINEIGCVNFYEVTGRVPEDVLKIVIGLDYSSHVGRQGGVQELNVSNANSNVGTIIHELMHTLGFAHEHNRPDRDDYIIIKWDNIKEGAKSYFHKYMTGFQYTNNSLPYDYKSIMHATNQQNKDIFIDMTQPIMTRLDGSIDLGQRAYLTDLDKERIKLTYRCGVCETKPDNFLFRYPGDCRKYYQCDHHCPTVRVCNADLHFNEEKKYCDYPEKAKCSY